MVDVGGFKRFRLINDLQSDLGSSFSIQGLVSYQRMVKNQSGGNKLNCISTGIRPAWHFHRYVSLVGELGLEYTTQEFNESGVLVKATISPQISTLNRILSHPASGLILLMRNGPTLL